MEQEHRGAQVTSHHQKPPTLSHDGLRKLINSDVFNTVQSKILTTGQSRATQSVYIKRYTLLYVSLFFNSAAPAHSFLCSYPAEVRSKHACDVKGLKLLTRYCISNIMPGTISALRLPSAVRLATQMKQMDSSVPQEHLDSGC